MHKPTVEVVPVEYKGDYDRYTQSVQLCGIQNYFKPIIHGAPSPRPI